MIDIIKSVNMRFRPEEELMTRTGLQAKQDQTKLPVRQRNNEPSQQFNHRTINDRLRIKH